LSLIPAFYASLSDTLLQIVPKLHQNISALQRNQVEVSIGRLVLLFASMFVFPFAFVAIIANGVPRIYGNLKLYKIAAEHSTPKAIPDAEVRKNILNIVKRILPGSIYYAISGQLIIWLISIFGTTENIAEVGALMRYSIIFGLLSTIVITVFIPDFSKQPFGKKRLRNHYFKYLFGLLFLVILIVIFVYTFSHPLLWILGDSYLNLEIELLLLIFAGGLGFISGIMFNLNSSKGWPSPPFILIPINISFVTIGVIIFDMSILTQVLYFNIFLSIPPSLVHVIYFLNKTRNL
jgi:O-antigen/teichoic acid export membrane protein